MRYGFYLPTRGPTATRDGILALAREGERLGFHSAMIADHIVLPVESQSTYPYTLDGKHPSAGDALETFSILGVVAGATERLRLVTSVLVLPYRNPVLTAKMAASLDVQWPLLPILRYPVRTIPDPEALPANLGRRAFSRRPATHRPAWRWLAPGRRRRRLAVTATRDARASRHLEAADRGRGPRFFGADDLL
jgi:Luciferase-like monooxygenase